jgi:predicted PurR-regulated permease PerM
MAKNEDKSLSLEYILAKQAENKSNLSAAIVKQLSAENINAKTISVKGGDKTESPIKIVDELKRLNKSFTSMLAGIAKMTTAISNNNTLLKALVTNSSKKVLPTSKNDLTQQDLETQDYQEKTMSLLQQLVSNTRPIKGKDEKGKFPWLTALALAALAAVAALKEWGRLATKIAKMFSPTWLKEKITGAFKKIGKVFEDLAISAGKTLRKLFAPIESFFKESFSKIKKLFAFSEESMIGRLIQSIRKGISSITRTFRNANRLIKLFTTGNAFGSWFSGIFESVSKIGKLGSRIARAFRVLSNLFRPLTIIIAAFDAITGAIEGFKAEGIKGAIAGALKGFYGTFVGGFFDFVKDIISWVSEKLGFNKFSEFLDSFSFEKLIKQFFDAVFHPIDTIKDMFQKLAGWFKDFEIPAIGFDLFGKHFGAGPWKPFASDEKPPEKLTGVAPAIEVRPENKIVSPPITKADTVYNQSGQNAEAAMYPFATPATNIVNAPTNISKQTQNNMMKVNVRDQDTSLKYYYRSRFTM